MIELSLRIRELFEKAMGDIDLPGFWRFPTGACEGASLFLGNTLKEHFPASEIEYVKGYKPNGEMHFWLVVNGLIFDITADQFKNIKDPIFGQTHQPLEAQFSDTEKQSIEDAFKSSDVTNETYKTSLMIQMRFHLTGNV